MATRTAAAVRAAFLRTLEGERRRLPLWLPVCLGLGIQLYFLLPAEPSGWILAAAVALPAGLLPWAALRGLGRVNLLLVAVAFAAAGFAAAAARTHLAAAPILAERVDATVEGRIAEISRSRTDRRRVELVDPVIYGLPAGETPRRVRVTLLEGDFARDVTVGERITVFARLGPPGAPVEPGGFDFRRHAWFEGLGAVGFARGPAVAAPALGSESLQDAVARWRGTLTDGILEALPGREGAFAAAILTGSRAEIRDDELQALRDSNLAHLLAISGLHMGLLAALIFGAVRYGLALFPGLASRLSSKKIAALAALAAAAAYLALSGASVATQRAFVMAAAALIAVLIDRPAISLRALAAAALAILLWRPESLLNAGFQMSFAATVALVAAYETALPRLPSERRGRLRRLLLYVVGLALTSVIAGLATAPFAAAHFHRLTAYGLPANLLAVPVMAFWVAPFGALTALLAPLGLHALPLAAMGIGISSILAIAEWAAALPGAVRGVEAAPAGAVALVTFGGLWLALWRTSIRLAGLAAMAAGLAYWSIADTRPEVLVAPRGALIGAEGPAGRALDRASGAGYAADSWLERDGDLATQEQAALRPGLERGDRRGTATLSNGWAVTLLRGGAPSPRVARRCEARTVVIAWGARQVEGGPCILLDQDALRRLGAVAVRPAGDGVRIDGSLPLAARRLWGRPDPEEAG
ncbi:MAG: ComEC/Rec2 family competence protein [Paracoccaceae bacterium]